MFYNIFFPQKDSIKKRIEFFAKDKEWYKQRGRPLTIEFMFHEKPGRGKNQQLQQLQTTPLVTLFPFC